MHVSVLGAFEVTRGETILTPSAPKLRRVFALLAMHANRVVRVDQIIEELWEDRPPYSATTTLQTYVYQLRKLLGRSVRARNVPVGLDSSVSLSTTPGGYSLSLPHAAVDAQQFELLVEEGNARLEADDLEGASRILHDALRLWRGPAFSAISMGPLLQAEAVRLEELRKIVLGHRIDIDFDRGRHAELVGELTALVAQEPTHEGFQAKLMLALYRTGRRSEALQVYQRAREALDAELGLEPTAELQRLHGAVLDADPSLDAPVIGAGLVRGGKKAEPPSQLPPDLPSMAGRTEPLREVHSALEDTRRSAPPVVLVVGAPGSGKSAFAVHAAHRAGTDYPDGIFYARLLTADGEPVPPEDVLLGFLTTVGLPQDRTAASQEALSRAFRSWTASRRVLVVLDDAVDSEQLEPLLPSGPGCATVVVGRRLLSHGAISSRVELPPLAAADAVGMLGAMLDPHRVAAESEAARELAELCEGLPVPLRAAADVLHLRPHWRIGRLVSRMRGDVGRLAQLATNRSSITRSVELTWQLLPEEQRTTFRTVARATSEPISLMDAAALLDIDESRAEALLEDLVESYLAEVVDAGTQDAFWYRFRPLFRTVAAGLDSGTGTPAALPVPGRRYAMPMLAAAAL
ncbi:BTAD domain-containing putative transcriptional regulator [Streptoverticillium reticulum]|uniref:AfsR/SARP family transcriptional regulator n=1 Tax=Streptoverticillium reticulum TaxID=1433415 RepID=UPI0039BEEFDF